MDLTTTVNHNFESLVTKDYLDTRFSEQSVRLDLLATEIDAKLKPLSSSVDSKIGLLWAEVDGKVGKLHVMFSVIMVGLALPIIQTLIDWLA